MADKSFKALKTEEAKQRLKAAAEAEAFDPRRILGFTTALVATDIRRALDASPGMTQKQLADLVGCSKQNIGQVLNDRANVSLKTLARICAALKRHLVVRILASDEAAPLVPRASLPAVRMAAQGLLTEFDLTKFSVGAGSQTKGRRILLYPPSVVGGLQSDFGLPSFMDDFQRQLAFVAALAPTGTDRAIGDHR